MNSSVLKLMLKRASHRPIIWWFDGSVGKLDGKSGSGSAHSDDRMQSWRSGWNGMEFDMSDSIGWIAYDYLFQSLREMHYGINFNKNRMRSVGQWEWKIGWNMSKHELHQITSFNSNNSTLFKIGQWDADLSYPGTCTRMHSVHIPWLELWRNSKIISNIH